jgi:phosphonate degradation associated HDIG domain protein
MMAVIDTIFDLFTDRGGEAYYGESVTQTEHALQAAHAAEEEKASDALIVAALLHDVGHLLHGGPEDLADQGIDDRHEVVGRAWLARHFRPEVTEPVRLHVPAKRYLCRVDPEYQAKLSPASVVSLQLQGGAMSPEEARDFEANPFAADAVRLRRWDDLAKVVGMDVPGLEHYRGRFAKLLGMTDLSDRGQS